MGRGLSELQKYILTAASSMKEDDYNKEGRLYYADIFRAFYGWKGTNGHPGGRKFDPNEIGQKKYDSAHVAVRKACARLEKRGFVACIMGSYSHWSGVEITDKGREMAATIMTKTNIADKESRILTPEEIAVLDRADNEPPEGSPCCDPWADIWICRKCWGGAFESFMFVHAPTFCPLCGAKNTLVRSSMVPDWSGRIKDASEKLKSCNLP